MATVQGNASNPTGIYRNGFVFIRSQVQSSQLPTSYGLVFSLAQRLPNNLDAAAAAGPIEGQIYPRAR